MKSIPVVPAALAFTLCMTLSACDGGGPDPVLHVTDGKLTAGEWDNATTVALPWGGEFLYDNDEENLYLALNVSDSTPDPNDGWALFFDNDNDGVLDALEDLLVAYAHGGAHLDNYYSDLSSQEPDAQDDGHSDVTHADDIYVFEIDHPLDSGDQHDFNLKIGDVVGFCLLHINQPGARNYPINCLGNIATYGHLTVK